MDRKLAVARGRKPGLTSLKRKDLNSSASGLPGLIQASNIVPRTHIWALIFLQWELSEDFHFYSR